MSDNPRPRETVGLKDGAQLIGVSPSTMRELAAAGKIPGAKPGRAWVFIREDLLGYLRSQYKPCPSTSAKTATSGGSTSVTLALGYGARLAQRIETRRKQSTTQSR